MLQTLSPTGAPWLAGLWDDHHSAQPASRRADWFVTDIVAMGFVLGGAAQIIAGIMEFKKNNTFGRPPSPPMSSSGGRSS